MKTLLASFAAALLAVVPLALSATFPIPESTASAVFADTQGTLVMVDTDAKTTSTFRPEVAQEKFAPCSTFKIWNTLIGLENGVISSPDEDFYHWDGEKRAIPDWNKNLTLKEAFRVSCVPAFQDLARKIGTERMQAALDKIGYGDRNISSGIDVFWLPSPGRKTILISPTEQATLMARLATGKESFTEKSQTVLKDIMTVRSTLRGTLYGKTGTGGDGAGNSMMGWFVGYVESNGKTLAFACLVQGKGLMGKDARAFVEAVLEKEGWL